MVWGIKAARWITSSSPLIVSFLLMLAWYFFIPDRITLIYFILFLIIPIFIVTGIDFKRESAAGHFIMPVHLLKFIMITGLSYMIVVNIIINRLS